MISSGGQTFHLKAPNETERQKWTTALELARVRAIKAADSGKLPVSFCLNVDQKLYHDCTLVDEEEELKLGNESSDFDRSDLKNALNSLKTKLETITTCQDLIGKQFGSFSYFYLKWFEMYVLRSVKHGTNLQRSLTDLEQLQNQNTETGAKIKSISERTNLFRLTTTTMVNVNFL